MYFTRDPVIETVITSRDGYKLTVRNSKHFSQDPFIVEALEVISLGNTCFFRNCDRSKPFVVPASDYEVLEVRDAKINLKAVGLDKGVKIAGGREALIKLSKPVASTNEEVKDVDTSSTKEDKDSNSSKPWKEKKRGRKKANKDIVEVNGASTEMIDTVKEEVLLDEEQVDNKKFSLIPPPTKLISEVLSVEEVSSDAVEDGSVNVATNESDVDLNESLEALEKEGYDIMASFLDPEEVQEFPIDSEAGSDLDK